MLTGRIYSQGTVCIPKYHISNTPAAKSCHDLSITCVTCHTLRLIDLLNAFETFSVAARSARGDMDGHMATGAVPSSSANGNGSHAGGNGNAARGGEASTSGGPAGWVSLLPLPPTGEVQRTLTCTLTYMHVQLPCCRLACVRRTPLSPNHYHLQGRPCLLAYAGFPSATPNIGLFGLPANRFDMRQRATLDSDGRLRDSLRFIVSPAGAFFRAFILEELAKSIDALSRDQVCFRVNSFPKGEGNE